MTHRSSWERIPPEQHAFTLRLPTALHAAVRAAAAVHGQSFNREVEWVLYCARAARRARTAHRRSGYQKPAPVRLTLHGGWQGYQLRLPQDLMCDLRRQAARHGCSINREIAWALERAVAAPANRASSECVSAGGS